MAWLSSAVQLVENVLKALGAGYSWSLAPAAGSDLRPDSATEGPRIKLGDSEHPGVADQ
jgi:hypothetical protein